MQIINAILAGASEYVVSFPHATAPKRIPRLLPIWHNYAGTDEVKC